MAKILIIGQYPPLQKQDCPYDTTMFYEWFEEIGINKDYILYNFHFESMTNELPNIGKNGGHLPPSKKEMQNHYNKVLKNKVKEFDKILLLGRCSMNFFKIQKFFDKTKINGKKFFTLIHPSRRNISLYRKNKNDILELLKELIKT